MKGGRLRIINQGRYPEEEVRALVGFGLDRIDLKGEGLLVIVKDTRRMRRRTPTYSGQAWSGRYNMPDGLKKLTTRREHFLVVVRIGPPEVFPIKPYTRNGILHDYRTWQEALVGITAHEGMHVQHGYDFAYERKSGYRRPATFEFDGKRVPFRQGGRVRVGNERIEPKCEAFERGMLERFRKVSNTMCATLSVCGTDQQEVVNAEVPMRLLRAQAQG